VLVLAAVGLVLVVGSVAGARRPEIPEPERQVFRAVNGLPDWLYGPLWLPMQLGNLVVGTVVGLVVTLADGEWRAALAVVAAMLLKLVTERVLRHEMAAYLTVRRRPGTSMPGAILRGDVPVDGPSFPSGHVLLAAAIACVVTSVLPAWCGVVALALALVVAVGRVYVGAHNPLDVTAGLGAGFLIGGLLGLLVQW
jgi:membrane-associated phospholipid phosphatase